MRNWEYLFEGQWLPVSEPHNETLTKRYDRPSLDTLCLKMDFGTLSGTPECRDMKFQVYGELEISRSRIRKCAAPGELSVIEVKDGNYHRILSHDTRERLFTADGRPKDDRLEHIDGSERFVCCDGELFQEIDGHLLNRHFGCSDLTKGELDDFTKTEYTWEFRGPFRWERMRMAVQKTIEELSAKDACRLSSLFSRFDPKEDATEYGPYQFDDYLSQNGEIPLAIAVMGHYHQLPLDTWQAFDAFSNARIENARASGRPMAMVRVKGHMYMLMFDSGSGASGAGPVLIRSMRYQKILESIEEQFESSLGSAEARRPLQNELYQILVDAGQNPGTFLMHALHSEDPTLSLPPAIRPEIERIMSELQSSTGREDLSTRIQQFMPALLEKFKECEIRLSPNICVKSKKLALKIARTLRSGMSVPKSYNCDWRTMIEFINREQCWEHTGTVSTCDICMEQRVSLRHCGTSSACLKCWVQTAVATKMSCPFCRQEILPGQLHQHTPTRQPQKPNRVNHKRKRVTQENTQLDMNTILSTIRQDELYKDVSPTTSFSMNKWFVILLRQGLIQINQRPKHEQSTKTLQDAAKEFKLL